MAQGTCLLDGFQVLHEMGHLSREDGHVLCHPIVTYFCTSELCIVCLPSTHRGQVQLLPQGVRIYVSQFV